MTIDQHSVAIVGLGLIGGSLAKDLAALHVPIIGYDADVATLDAACMEGIVQERLDGSLAGLERATIIVIAVPVSATLGVLTTARAHLAWASLIMDAGSTKRSAIAAAQSLGISERFVGSHPMAGDHRSGWSAARARLFEGATVYLCPAKDAAGGPLALARELWNALGAHTELIDAGEHDQRVALTSHLPQAASAALALTLSSAGVSLRELGPGGRDALRIAGSSPEMWTAIVMDNADAILEAMSDFEGQLGHFKVALETLDHQRLHDFFRASRNWAS